MTPLIFAALAANLAALPALHWDPGTADDHPQPHSPIEVRSLDASTYVLRESLHDTWEAPFLYLLIGRDRALLLDTGDVADPAIMPLATTVIGLLPVASGGRLPLIVLHTHGHLDHRAGDPQLAGLPGVELVPATVEALTARFGFTRWPDGAAALDLGGRIIDVLPAPGHHPAELVLYDRNSELVFSGDFLLPGRLLVNDRAVYAASARRVAGFLRDKPVRGVLGGHIEKPRTASCTTGRRRTTPTRLRCRSPRLICLRCPTRSTGSMASTRRPATSSSCIRRTSSWLPPEQRSPSWSC